jgi:hypothetical protein
MVYFPKHHATTKCNKTGMMMMVVILQKYSESGQSCRGYCSRYVTMDRSVAGALYLQWFLCGRLISDGAAEIFMVGKC